MDLARSPSQAEVIGQPKVSSYEYSVTFGQPRRVQNRVYISPTEAKHLAVAALLVVAIGFSIAFYAGYMETYSFGWTWTVTSVFAVVLMASFLVHEMAHKVASQRRGLWAEFRLTTWGAVLTLISVVLPFKLISPGAVMISGPARLEDVGKISIAGPITNMAFSATFLGISFAVEPLSWWWLFVALAMFNATIAIFNLIPIGILDGFKIFSWNRKVWALAFAVAVALAVPAYVLASRFMYFF
jgi:Zn-dependent protease